ncbi:NotI family restriction endonuclease [Pectobacterium brasiliense]|uniref:NotI family restriction endonuclease n=1 Tax=Pectobacterium brasiliense TaxID=180957 RepID=UPI00196965B2|nr:NotI family restriction endonuclease [Pectobacterium brasiliense]MBN3263384.1 restriction endonuclease [Pectobacterium brasiliense]
MSRRDLVEVFGYNPDDLTPEVRALWNLGGCPFINKECIKINHDQTIIYGTCSVTSTFGDVIICPNRLYSNNYETLVKVCNDAFGESFPMLTFNEYIEKRASVSECIVALGKNSGKEVQIGRALSMDWVLAKIIKGTLIEYVGVEIQSIDITGNYRDAWHAYRNLKINENIKNIPTSQHGLNWANVHKRLIPQLIRKGVVYSRSSLVRKGLYFILPDIVYRKFEDVIGSDIPLLEYANNKTITVYTYELSDKVSHGCQRDLRQVRKIIFDLDEFSNRFITGPNLPSGEELDKAIMKSLGFFK